MGLETSWRGHARDLGGGFSVQRVLPAVARRTVGPFVFVDHFGPAQLEPGAMMDVRPHPHIGLATVTYLFDGTILHRDSLGSVQRIESGAINWMVAGRGIVHSERTPPDLRERAHAMHGMQIWVALPAADEETAPAFVHYPQADLPRQRRDGVQIEVLIGAAFGERSPVAAASPTLYCALTLDDGARLALEPAPTVAADRGGDVVEERALYVCEGAIDVDGRRLSQGEMGLLDSGPATCLAGAPARVMLLGGAPLGERFIWWNFVSSRRERIEQAKAAWRAQSIGQVPGETEFIPLPEK